MNVVMENFKWPVNFTLVKNYQFMISCNSKCIIFFQLIFVSMVSIWCMSICTKPIISWYRRNTFSTEPTRSLSTLSLLKNAACINQFLKYQTKFTSNIQNITPDTGKNHSDSLLLERLGPLYLIYGLLNHILSMSMHKSIAHPHTVDGGESLYIWRICANTLNIHNCKIRSFSICIPHQLLLGYSNQGGWDRNGTWYTCRRW